MSNASVLPGVLSCSTFAFALLGAAVVYGERGAWGCLPVLLAGLGTALVASAISLPGGPQRGFKHAWQWLRGTRDGHQESGPVAGKPWCLYVGVWLILAGTASAALIP